MTDPNLFALHTGILGMTGSGKTNTAKTAVEDLSEQYRVCILDPIKSDWWGITSSSDGKAPGLPFSILGGPHAHVPLHAGAGAVIGRLVGEGHLRHSIIDMADFPMGGAQRFFVEFADALMKHMEGVLYLVLEEAHEFAPKERSGVAKENMAVYFAKRLATAGRSKGIRLLVVSHRVQSLHNAVLGSCDTMIVHRLTAPADQAPVKTWLDGNVVDDDQRKTIKRSMGQLDDGEAWVCSSRTGKVERTKFRRIRTFDNSATPTSDTGRTRVAQAAVDVGHLRKLIGDEVAVAKENDVEALKARIALLESEKALDVDFETLEDNERLRKSIDQLQDTIRVKSQENDRLRAALERARDAVVAALDGHLPERTMRGAAEKAGEIDKINVRVPADLNGVKTVYSGLTPPKTPVSTGGLSASQQRVVDSVAWWNAIGVEHPDTDQVAAMAHYSNNGRFRTLKSECRGAGLIDYPAEGLVMLTEKGRAASMLKRKPKKSEVVPAVRERLPPSLRKLFDVLVSHHPRALTSEELARGAGYQCNGRFRTMRSELSTMGLVEYPKKGTTRARDFLFP